MSNELTQQQPAMSAEVLSSVLLGGDISKLAPAQKVEYMLGVCKSLGLNPTTKPFEFISLNGKLQMYARKDCTEQLRKIHGVSIKIVGREVVNDVYVVTAQATDKFGKCDESLGAVPISGLKGEAVSNAMMKAETKAKRRVTLSICGLGMLDESEVSSIPGASVPAIEAIKEQNAGKPAAEVNGHLVEAGFEPQQDLEARARCQAIHAELKAISHDAMKESQSIKQEHGGDYAAMEQDLADCLAKWKTRL